MTTALMAFAVFHLFPIAAAAESHEAGQAWAARAEELAAARRLRRFDSSRLIQMETGFQAEPLLHGHASLRRKERSPAAKSDSPAGVEVLVSLVDRDGTFPADCDLQLEASSLDIRTYGVRPAEVVLDASERPMSARFVLNSDGPSDIKLSFSSAVPGCRAQGLVLRRIWPSRDVEIELELTERPQPEIRVLDRGVDIGYHFVSFCTPDRTACRSVVPDMDRDAGLRAGETYVASVLGTAARHTPASQLVTVPEGEFELRFDVEPVVDTFVAVSQTWGLTERGLVEFRRDGKTVIAHELGRSGNEIASAPGSFDVRVSGLSGRVAGGDLFVLRTREFEFQADGSNLILGLAPPPHSVMLAGVPDPGMSLLVLQDGIPVAAIPVAKSGETIHTDFEHLDLVLRGPGLADVSASVSTTEGAVLDVAAIAQEPTALSGRVLDDQGQPQSAAPIYLWSADGVAVARYETAADGSFVVPLVRGATASFGVTSGGNTVQQHHRILNPRRSATVTVSQPSMVFQPLLAEAPIARIAGSGEDPIRIAFVAEGYVAQRETFDDLNENGVWDGRLYFDLDGDGRWQPNEPISLYGERGPAIPDTDPTVDNEPFEDLNGDQYPSINDLAVFERNVQNYLRALLSTPYVQQANVSVEAWAVFLPSEQAGMDYPGLVERATRFDARFDPVDRSLDADTFAVYEALDDVLDYWHRTVVMVNQPVQLGRANDLSVFPAGLDKVSPNSNIPGHEFGHMFFLLDEYDLSGATSLRPQLPAGQVTDQPQSYQSPWADQIQRQDRPVSVPGSSGPGIFAGARYFAGGVYRATSNSRMRLLSLDFNEPSRDLISRFLCPFTHDKAPSNATESIMDADVAQGRLAARPGMCGLNVSGLWYNADQPGHGWLVEHLDPIAPGGPDRVLAHWLVYRDGMPAWLTGVGDIVGNRAELPMFVTRGGPFPPDFHAEGVEVNAWGRLQLEFGDGGVGLASWASPLAGFESGSMPIAQLAGIPEVPAACRSGTYHASGQSGQGVSLQVLRIEGRLQLLAAWFIYRDGEPIWLLGQGPLTDDRAEFTVREFSGADFPPEFRAEDVSARDWGIVAFNWAEDGTMRMDWQTAEGGLQRGQLAMERLSTVRGRQCLQVE